MKKLAISFILAAFYHLAVKSQCGLNYQDILDRYCKGVYLQHMELDNISGEDDISLVLKENNRYAFYLLNPSYSIPIYKLSGENKLPVSDEVAKYSKEGNFATYSFRVNEAGVYHFTYNFNTDKRACVLLAIYLQNKIAFDAGIYKTFEEFKYNNPSVKLNFDIVSKTQKIGLGKGAEEVTYYRLDFSRNKARNIGEIFGFSDGKNLYINSLGGKTGYGKDFVKVKMFSKYGYFESIGQSTIVAGSVVTTSTFVEYKLIDMNTGEIITLNNKKLREVMADDKKLLEAFDNEPRKQTKLREYILKYLSTHNRE